MIDKVQQTELMGQKNFTQEDVRTRLGEIYDFYNFDPGFNVDGKYRSTKNIFGARVFNFKNDKLEFEYLNKYGNLRGGIIANVYRHQKKLLTKTSIYNQFGADPGFVLSNMKRVLAKTDAAKKGDFVVIEKRVDSQLKDLLHHTDKLTVGEETAYSGIRAINNLISATLTGFSAIRDVVADKTVITGLNRAMMTDGSAVRGIMASTASLANAFAAVGKLSKSCLYAVSRNPAKY